jgi:magnesium-transporting ATPase (P-type)
MCQQKLTQKQYYQIMQQCQAKRHLKTTINNELDLNGFPENNYCFLGFFSLLDSPRVDVSDAILKLRRAQIRVVMITGDHSTTAKAISKQVNILSSQISERNGIDTIKIESNQNGQLIFRLHRNETLLREHVPAKVTPFTADRNKIDHVKIPSWYKRYWSWFENQFREPKSILKQEREKERIPYAIVVSL